jgi:multisubunit Na+/H+ antiporter MnhC subunit
MTLAWLIGGWVLSLSLTAIVVGVATLAVPALWALSYERRSVKDLFSH